MTEEPNDKKLRNLLDGFPEGEHEEIKQTWKIASTAGYDPLGRDQLSSAFHDVERRIAHSVGLKRVVLLRAASLAATLVVGILAGYLISQSGNSSRGVHEAASGESLYLLLIHNDASEDALVKEDIVTEFRDWAIQLARDGRLVDAAELAEGGRVLFVDDDGAGRADLSMIEERATGYFLFTASNQEEAETIAAGCPHLRRGGTVELREVVRGP